MNNDTCWLARLGIDQGLFTRPHCLQIRAKLGDHADVVGFAQELVDSGIVTNLELLEKLADLAMTKGEKGPPANDPFDESNTTAPFVQTGPAATVAIATMSFRLPVFVGDEVSCYGEITKVGNTSITIKVESWVRRGVSNERIKVTEGLFTYVAIGPDRRPRPVPAEA